MPEPECDIEAVLNKESATDEAMNEPKAEVFIHYLSARNESNLFPLSIPGRDRVLYRIVPEETIVCQENRNQRERGQ